MDITLEHGGQSVAQNRVMRNTYWLLALSLLPTIGGAWAGIELGFASLFADNAFIGFMVFMAVAIGFIFAINATKDSVFGVVILLAFTAFMGMVMSPLIGSVLGRENGVALVSIAAGGTAGIFAVMAFLSTVIKRDISGWSKFLFIGLIGVIVAMVANIFLQLTILALVISSVAVMLFSAYLLFDLKRIVDGGETNYITATLAVYLDLVNIFQNLLVLLGITSSDD